MISADRSHRGELRENTVAAKRQAAYAEQLGDLDIIGFSLARDGFVPTRLSSHARTYPTGSSSKFLYGFDALRIARRLPMPDVITAQDPFETGFVAWLIARRLGVPLHVQVHTDFLSAAYRRHSLLNRVRVWIARFVLSRAAGVRVVSERIANSLRTTHYALRTTPSVLPIFVDFDRFRHASHDAALEVRFALYETKLLVVSRLEKEKNVALALHACKESAPRDACLIIVGDGSEREALEAMARALGIRGQVFFEGAHDAASYYKMADLVLVPSRYEGYGLVIVEALAAGKPVLSTDVGIADEAGATITSEALFGQTLARWFSEGPREGVLRGYPYASFDEYVRAYRDDIAACIEPEKGQ